MWQVSNVCHSAKGKQDVCWDLGLWADKTSGEQSQAMSSAYYGPGNRKRQQCWRLSWRGCLLTQPRSFRFQKSVSSHHTQISSHKTKIAQSDSQIHPCVFQVCSLTQRAWVYSHKTPGKHFSFMGVRYFKETTVVSSWPLPLRESPIPSLQVLLSQQRPARSRGKLSRSW